MNRITQYFSDEPLDDLPELRDFQGRGFDPALPLQFNQQRHCDPTPGKWLSEEPVGYAGGAAEHLTPYVAPPLPPPRE